MIDTYLCEYTIPNLNHIIFEANYCDEIRKENIIKGIEHPSKLDRPLTFHMELETTKEVLMAQDLFAVQDIIITHLSDRTVMNPDLWMRSKPSLGNQCMPLNLDYQLIKHKTTLVSG